MWTREQVKSNAKLAFKPNYWMCVLVSLIAFILIDGFTFRINYDISGTEDFFNISNIYGLFAGFSGVFGILGLAVSILVAGPIEIGRDRFYMENRFYKTGVEKIGYGFTSGSYGNCVFVMFMKGLFTFLWTLLLVIPGIVKAYEYRMIPYILSENPAMSRERAFAISKMMMDGQKMDAFILDLSFIGWYIVAAVTCGIAGVFYVTPYVDATNAELYTALRTQVIGNGMVLPGELPGFE